MNSLADRLRWILKTRRLTQQKLAELATAAGKKEISQQNINALITRAEKDADSKGSPDTLLAIARAIGLRVEWLIDGEGEPEARQAADAEAADRYPNRAEAIRLLGARLDPDARATLLSRSLASHEDLTVDQWMDEGLALHRKAKQADLTFDEVEAQLRAEKGDLARRLADRDTKPAPVPPPEPPVIPPPAPTPRSAEGAKGLRVVKEPEGGKKRGK